MILVLSIGVGSPVAQDGAENVAAVRAWGEGFAEGRIDVDAKVSEASASIYGAEFVSEVRDRLEVGLTHLGALRILLDRIERQPSAEAARAVLPLAAAGIEHGLADHRALLVREAAQWTLARLESNDAWLLLMNVAGGAGAPIAEQVAALRALGMRNRPVFRPTISRRLLAADPRVRLAAAEALARMRDRNAIPVLARALGAERHPVVAQALVAAIDRTMRRHIGDLRLRESYPPLRAAIRRLGTTGWRTDLAIVALLERFPVHDAIPVLIDILDETTWGRDELTETVNEHASPILRERAWRALRRLTGAILPLDAPSWREFWSTEGHKIALKSAAWTSRRRAVTSAGFYGIPVVGREVAFVIDCSNSMRRPVVGAQNDANGTQTRLEAAKEQLLRAVQGIHAKSRYHLLTFSAVVREWSARAVTPTPESYRQLTECVERIGYEGGTDVNAALMRVLDADRALFGAGDQSEIDEVFLISDGEPVSGDVTDPELILKLVREVNRYRKVRINTVFIGAGDGAELMRRVAEENDGAFVRV